MPNVSIDMTNLIQELVFVLRMVLACLCGGAIGFERKRRLKEAGIRTHLIVALGACVMMIISKYGFYDLSDAANTFWYPGDRGADPARIAAQVVSGVGFLGAGVIFVRGRSVSGLTTAAGLWLTAGVGLALGGGLYGVGISATVIILVVQALLHNPLRHMEGMGTEDVTVTMDNTEDAMAVFRDQLARRNIQVLESSIIASKDGSMTLDLTLKSPNGLPLQDQWEMTRENPHIKAIKF